ncbi:hypothetical protein [Kosmotoga sp. DU53]|uniref:hypothetical protein n=1 Tax=Kosmotoga sp. DU53 TaxID=1310160 RepID=UPI0007C5993F|nr:hypothetical protein [Kosmotoga sp. DU53]OAA22180.1 hypothetical protein DU53_04885 [Kosmotoga sp. DU53]
MRIHVGGFCLQGLVAIPVLEKLLSEKKQRLEIIANGLAGFYAILFESFGKEEARKRLQGFIKKFEGTLRVINRRQKSENIDKKTDKEKADRVLCSLVHLDSGPHLGASRRISDRVKWEHQC